MRHDVIGRGLRLIRHRNGLRQSDVSSRSGVSRGVVADLERGRLDHHSVGALVAVAKSLGASVRLDLVAGGGDLYRLLDSDHAALQSAWMTVLRRRGWTVEAEVTFNHYGERGSIDLLAWDPETGPLLVVEIKTTIVDIQELLAGLDRKLRIAQVIARQRGWHVRAAIPGLVVADGTTARRRLAGHDALFARFDLRGRAALSWLAAPYRTPAPRGLLCFSKLPDARSGDRRRAGRQRVRLTRADSRSA